MLKVPFYNQGWGDLNYSIKFPSPNCPSLIEMDEQIMNIVAIVMMGTIDHDAYAQLNKDRDVLQINIRILVSSCQSFQF